MEARCFRDDQPVSGIQYKFTTQQVAAELGVTVQTVLKRAKARGVKTAGRAVTGSVGRPGYRWTSAQTQALS